MNTIPYIIVIVLFHALWYVTLSGAINLFVTENDVLNIGQEPTGFSGQQRPPFCPGHWCTNPGRQDAIATKYFTVAPNVYGSSVWFLHLVTILAPRNTRRVLDF
jgi:hypothetical protein